MSQSEQHDCVLGEEFDDYDDRSLRSLCRTITPRRGSRSLSSQVRKTRHHLNNADVFLIMLMVGLTAGIVWLIYNTNINDCALDSAASTCPPRAKCRKKIQKPSLLKKLWCMIRPCNSKRCRKYFRRNINTNRVRYASRSTARHLFSSGGFFNFLKCFAATCNNL
uniref:Transmembrane protein n=1 Tax=Schizaphis graminum TaxID=13262 RepID=A0A2S2NW20_SCHGA